MYIYFLECLMTFHPYLLSLTDSFFFSIFLSISSSLSYLLLLILLTWEWSTLVKINNKGPKGSNLNKGAFSIWDMGKGVVFVQSRCVLLKIRMRSELHQGPLHVTCFRAIFWGYLSGKWMLHLCWDWVAFVSCLCFAVRCMLLVIF